MKNFMRYFIKECGLWLAGFIMLAAAIAFTMIATPEWWPSFLGSPTVCFAWAGIFLMTKEKLNSFDKIEEVDGHLYRNCGDEVMCIKTDVYVDDDVDIESDSVSTTSTYYWAKTES